MNTMKKKIWQVLEGTEESGNLGKVVNSGILTLIFINIVAVILGTVASIQTRWGEALDGLETVSVLVFVVEYTLRLWTCVEDKRFSRPFQGRFVFALRPMALLDLAAILPFLLPFVTADVRILRIFRLFRIVRLAKVGRYYTALNLFASVFRTRKEEIVLSTVMMLVLLIVSSCLLYYFENEAQPDLFSSIPHTMWWAVATLTTVGYGDIYPITGLGKFTAGIISILGIGMFALPTGLLGAGFIEEIEKRKRGSQFCPHCGKEL